ncbi:MAG TPA: efflux RND transporter periplasmic adaptor subunit [Acetobacteraceae bacterium]|jgi:membrane fusion protein, multidrug efflux system|nr:efflux RND transporter periplasmic adaptor subunit [Acetobacteraceae bacterium]
MQRAWHLAAMTFLSLLAAAGCKRQQTSFVAPPPPHVVVAQPLRQAVTPYLDATGNLVAYNQVDLVARVSGFLQSINYTDGAIVHTGQTLFVIEPAPYQAKLQQAQATLQAAQALAVQTDTEYQRQASLGRTDFSSRSTVDQALAARDSNRANVVNDQAGVAVAAINLGYTQVTAPFDGFVTAHQVSLGSLVGQNSPTTLATIYQIDPIYVSFTISEQDVQRVQQALREAGISAKQLDKVRVDVGLMTETGYPHSGHLDYASPNVDQSSGTLTVRGILSNADHALLPGFFVRVRVPMPKPKGESLLVPETALGTDQAGRYLLVVNKDNVVQQRTVTTGQSFGTLRVIATGLQPDDHVIVSGLQRAVPGDKVAPETTTITAAMPAADRS